MGRGRAPEHEGKMKKISQITGLCGLVITALGLFARLIQGKGSLFITLHLLLGGVLLGLGILTNLAELQGAFAKRQARYGTGALIQLALWIAVLGMVNYLGVRHNWLKDLTQKHLFTLSEQTQEILRKLPGPVAVTAFFPSDASADDRRRLEIFAKTCPSFQLGFVDPDKHPEIAEKKSISAYGTLLFEYGGKAVRITQHEESDITNALIKTTRTGEKVIYFLAGHEEADPSIEDKAGLSILRQALENQNYQLRGFFLTMTDIPADAAVVVIASPRLPLAQEEIAALEKYLARGGNLLALLDPQYETNLEPLLKRYNLAVHNDLIIDEVHYLSSKGQMGLSPICQDIRRHPVTENLSGKLLVFPRARSLTITSEHAGNLQVAPLIYSSKESYGETNFSLLLERGLVRHDPDDLSGPLLVAAAVTENIPRQPWEQEKGQPKSEEMRLVVVGNSRFLRNGDLDAYSNFLLALNILNWLAGEEEYIFLPSVKRMGNRVFLSRNQKEIIFYATVLILPELLMIAGAAIWWRRR